MSLEKFDLVGVRYKRYHFDEAILLGHPRDSVESYYEINCADPTISDFKYKDRQVIEVLVSVKQVLLLEDATNKSELKTKTDILTVECVAGFVGASQADDGNLNLFSKAEESWARVIYWLVRQRIRSLMMGTLLDSAGLPHDIRNIKTVPTKKVGSVSKSKPTKKPSRKRAQGG